MPKFRAALPVAIAAVVSSMVPIAASAQDATAPASTGEPAKTIPSAPPIDKGVPPAQRAGDEGSAAPVNAVPRSPAAGAAQPTASPSQ